MKKSIFENLLENKKILPLIEDKGFNFVDELKNNYDVVYSYKESSYPFSDHVYEYADIKFPSSLKAFEFAFDTFTKSQIRILVSSLQYLNQIFSIKETKDVDEDNFVIRIYNNGGVNLNVGYFSLQMYLSKIAINFGDYDIHTQTKLKEFSYERIYEAILFEYKKRLNGVFREGYSNVYTSKHFKALKNVMTSHDLFALRTERVFKKEKDYLFARKLSNFKNIEVIKSVSMSYELKSKINYENIVYVAGDERIQKNVANTVKLGSTMIGFKSANIDYLDILLKDNIPQDDIDMLKKSLKIIITIEKAFGQQKEDAIIFERYNNDKVSMHNLSMLNNIVSIYYARSNISIGTKISANMYGYTYKTEDSFSYKYVYEAIKSSSDKEIATFLEIPVESVTENDYHLVEMMHY